MNASTWSLPTEPPDVCEVCGRPLNAEGVCETCPYDEFDCICNGGCEECEDESQD